MKIFFTLLILFILISKPIVAQSDCNSPLHVDLCSGISYTNQTNAGMGDDANTVCNITGEDVVYEIFAPNGARELFVSLSNVSSSMNVFLEQNACGTSTCDVKSISPGNSNLSFRVNPASYYYVWIDAATTVTYDIAFGGDTGSVYVSIPNTQGNLSFDSSGCSSPVFSARKPFFQVSYNDSLKTNPMTLSPLYVTGRMCITTYFKNTSGMEGVRIFDFHFDTVGFVSVMPQQIQFPGYYAPGIWVASHSGSDWTYKFTDAAGLAKGDFSGSPNSCLAYAFWFDVVPLTNDPIHTNVQVSVTSDGFGTGFSGIVNRGCCPVTNAACMNSSLGNPAGSTHAFAFGFNDPGALPVSLLSFTAEPAVKQVVLRWVTASEINNDYFTVEKSNDLLEWSFVKKVEGAGTASMNTSYQAIDENPFWGMSYYRLKQTDYDGTSTYSVIRSVTWKEKAVITVSPNPASSFVNVNAGNRRSLQYAFFNALGISLQVPVSVYPDTSLLDVSRLSPGLYVLSITEEDVIIDKIMVSISN